MGDKFEAHEHKGHLLLVYPKRFEEDVKTTKGLSDATDCDVIVVDKFGPDGAPLTFHGARLFGNLARSVRNDIGGQVLGRLQQITSANGNTPWILENFTDQDAAAATPVDAAYKAGQFRQPQGAPTPPTPASQGYAPPPQQQSWTPAAPSVPAAPPATAASTTAAPQQWQQPQAPAAQWNAPAPTAAPTPPAPAPVAAYDPQLVAFLQSKGITPPPDEAVAIAIANSFQS